MVLWAPFCLGVHGLPRKTSSHIAFFLFNDIGVLICYSCIYMPQMRIGVLICSSHGCVFALWLCVSLGVPVAWEYGTWVGWLGRHVVHAWVCCALTCALHGHLILVVMSVSYGHVVHGLCHSPGLCMWLEVCFPCVVGMQCIMSLTFQVVIGMW